MPRTFIDESTRMQLFSSCDTEAGLVEVAALSSTDLCDFVTQQPRSEADAVVETGDIVQLSTRDHAIVLALLERPPCSNTRLKAVIAALPATL